MKEVISLLSHKQQLTVEEAARLIAAGSGIDPDEGTGLLTEAIEQGTLPARIERWEVVDYFDGNFLGAINTMASTIQRADLTGWCRKMGFALPDDVKTEQSDVDASVARASGNTTAAQLPSKARRNALDDAIEEAISKTGSLTAAAVFQQLTEMALGEVSPFNGVRDGALLYTRNGNQKELTESMLASRLSRRRGAAR